MVLRVLLAGGPTSVHSRIRELFENAPDIQVVAAVASGVESVRLAHDLHPDVVLIHARSEGTDGIEIARQIVGSGELSHVHTMMLADSAADESVLGALNSGVRGFLERDAQTETLVEAVRAVARGEAHLSPAATRCVLDKLFPVIPSGSGDDIARLWSELTPREREVVSLAALGLDNKAISSRLIVSHFTVKTHITRAMAKLDVRSRAQLVAEVHRSGLVRKRDGE
ncbi:LuxR C-terminal-related transcriptional regulator [Streptomyces sp. NPDC048282]|uniref:LuxR C-terminal-related transcriptional regulator n=1 Tax=Streptomyces sp. NPDC048282 TaxID=3365528 RepID=UPI003717EA0C